jgi:bacterioferritin
MVAKNEPTNIKTLPLPDPERLVLDEAAIDAARRSLDQGAVTPHYGPWRQDVIKLLNNSWGQGPYHEALAGRHLER